MIRLLFLRLALLLTVVLFGTSSFARADLLVTSGDLRGQEVRGSGGEVLGAVETVLIDLKRGRLGYLVVAASAPEQRNIIVPWPAVRIAAGGELSLTVDPIRFQQAPFAFKEGDHGYALTERAIHNYFGVFPCREEEAPGKGPRPTAPRGLQIIQ